MKIIYKNTELQHNTREYNSLLNKPSLNGKVLEGNRTLDELSLYDKPEVERLVEAVSQIRLVTEMPTDPEPNMTYYVGPDERDLYDVILVNDAKQQIHMGTTQFGQYKSGPGVNVAANNTININTDDVSVYIDSEGNIAASLDGEALPAFTGATASTAGTKGLVPKPLRGQQNSVLFGDSTWRDLIEMIYPVGSILLTYTSSDNPNTVYSGTTWTKLDSGYVLWSDDTGGGVKIDRDGAPKIEGFGGASFCCHQTVNSGTGAMKYIYGGRSSLDPQPGGAFDSRYGTWYFDLSKGNSIYGASNVVQPPAYKIVAWQRTA